ncbi:MAG: hypothetical protein ACRDZ1_13490 [Acidimicrobiia bacterium]
MASRDLSWAAVRSWGQPAVTIGGALALWLLLAFANRGTTYHFAPLIVAAAGPVTARLDAAASLPWGPVVALAAASVAAATLGVALLWPFGGLDGPALVGGAPAETALAVAVGSAAGLLIARFPGRGRRRATPAPHPHRHGRDP